MFSKGNPLLTKIGKYYKIKTTTEGEGIGRVMAGPGISPLEWLKKDMNEGAWKRPLFFIMW